MLFARLVYASVAVLASTACLPVSQAAAQSTNVVIGLLLPPEEPSFASLRNGVILGVERANENAGPPAQCVIRGRTGQWGADGVEAVRMVAEDGARGLITPPDGAASHLVLQVSGRTAVPVVSLCGDSSVSQTGIPWMVRIVPRTDEEAKALFQGIHASHWLAVVPAGRRGREAVRDLSDAATNSGCSIEKTIEASSSVANPAKCIKQILTNHPDAVLLWLDPPMAGTLANALRAAGFKGTLAGPGRLQSADFAARAGSAKERMVVPAPVLDKEALPACQHFSTTFHHRFGYQPDPTAAAAYDAATLLIEILRQSAGHPPRETFPLRSSFAGASGMLSFDSRGDRRATLQLLEVSRGRFVPAGTEGTNAACNLEPKLY